MMPSSFPSVLHLAFLLWIASLATQGATAVRRPWLSHVPVVYLDGLEGKDGSTADMVDWSIKAAHHWQREMTRLHQMLLARASPEVRERLKEAQSRWEKFEEAELALMNQRSNVRVHEDTSRTLIVPQIDSARGPAVP